MGRQVGPGVDGDEALDAAYGWSADTSGAACLRELLALSGGGQ